MNEPGKGGVKRVHKAWGCPACGRQVKCLPNGKIRTHKGRLGEDRGDGWCHGSGFDPNAPGGWRDEK